MRIIERAIIFATEKHSGAVRKGNDIPYIVHPMEALSIAATMTNDPKFWQQRFCMMWWKTLLP